jgi:hypothetical protein
LSKPCLTQAISKRCANSLGICPLVWT